jgi:hypothetical protein
VVRGTEPLRTRECGVQIVGPNRPDLALGEVAKDPDADGIGSLRDRGLAENKESRLQDLLKLALRNVLTHKEQPR